MNPFTKFSMMSELSDTMKGSLQVKTGQVKIIEPGIACGTLTDRLIYNAVFHPDLQIKATSRWLIKAIAQVSQIFPASLNGILECSKQQEKIKWTLPVFRVHGLSYTVARAIFRAAKENKTGTMIFEIDRDQILHANQTPGEYSTIVLAAAIREKYRGPVFIQADYISIHKGNYQQNPNQEKQRLKILISEALASGLLNLWIDTSQDHQSKEGKENKTSIALLYAEITNSVRTLEPRGIDISMGCQLNPFRDLIFKEQDVKEFMEHYQAALQSISARAKGISKLGFSTEGDSSKTIQIKRPHDLEALNTTTLIKLSYYAHEKYGLITRMNLKPSHISQSTLKRFSETGNSEIIMPLEYQALIINHPDFPSEFKDKLNFNFPNGFEEGKFRSPISHKLFGVFKEDFWTLPEPLQQDISKEVENRVSSLFKTVQTEPTQEWAFLSISNPPVPLGLSEEMEICKKEKAGVL